VDCLRTVLAGLLVALLAGAAPPPAGPQAVGTWWSRTAPTGGRLPTSRHYAIRSDLEPAQTKAYADHLDIMYDEFVRRLVDRTGLRRQSPEHPTVLMFRSQQDYLDTLRTQFGVNGTGSAGMFFVTGRGAGLAFWTEGVPRQRVLHVVQHEGFHQFAYAFFGNELPPWLNEGLAEFFGESVVEGTRVIVGQASPGSVATVRKAVESGTYIPFLDILSMDKDRWNANVRGGTAATQYPQSWSMVHYLVYGENGVHERCFSDMLRRLNAGTRPLDALKQSLNIVSDREVAEFEARWKKYAAELKPGAYVAARARLEFLAEGLREVWSKGERPADLAALKAAMREARFRLATGSHGFPMTLDASDDANFTVPDDDVNRGPVSIELVPQKPAKGAKAKKLEADHPMPPMLRTRGLKPNEVGVAWTRSADDPASFDYDIVVE
jgi:hypothetical protein